MRRGGGNGGVVRSGDVECIRPLPVAAAVAVVTEDAEEGEMDAAVGSGVR